MESTRTSPNKVHLQNCTSPEGHGVHVYSVYSDCLLLPSTGARALLFPFSFPEL